MMGVRETPAWLFYDFCLDEHVLAVVLICALSDAFLITLGVTSFGASRFARLGSIRFCAGVGHASSLGTA